MAERLIGLVHPIALATLWVVSVHADTGTPLWALWRPLLVTAAAVLVVQLALTAVTRRPRRAAFGASAIAMAGAGLWPLAALFALAVAAPPVVAGLQRATGRAIVPAGASVQFARMGAFAGVASVVALAVAVTQAAAGGAYWDVPRPAASDVSPSAGAPDIYLVLLDGYPRSDTLRTAFGYDNSAFESALADRGFAVADDARSNYSITWLTLSSVLQMNYAHLLPELADVPERGPEQYRRFGALVNDSPAVEELRDAGYRIVGNSSPFSEIDLVAADEALPFDGPTWFEAELIAESPISDLLAGPLRSWMGVEQRDALRTALARIPQVAAREGGRPTFMLSHLMSPHPPFVHNADGSARELPSCYPGSCALYESNPRRLGLTQEEHGAALAGQVEYLNARLIETIDAVIERSPDAVIVLFSDHGTRHDPVGDVEETTRTFLAARTPGYADLLGDRPHTVNLMAGLLNAYLGSDHPMRPYRAWVSHGYPMELEPLDEAASNR